MAANDMAAKWDAFCDTLKAAGQELTNNHVPQDEQSQAEGLRYLSRMARAALEWYVEFNDAPSQCSINLLTRRSSSALITPIISTRKPLSTDDSTTD